jgi:predicted methyltransferase
MASRQDLIQSIKNRKLLELNFPGLNEKEKQRQKIKDDVAKYLKTGGTIKEVDHTANKSAQDKTTLNRYQNQKIKNKITWALDREAEITNKSKDPAHAPTSSHQNSDMSSRVDPIHYDHTVQSSRDDGEDPVSDGAAQTTVLR